MTPFFHPLHEAPLWRAGDLGAPIPHSPHAVSVCLPTWRDVVGYEENDERVRGALQSGYPRFVYNRFCQQLFQQCEDRWGREGETCLAFPGPRAAQRCSEFLAKFTGHRARIEYTGSHGVYAVCFPRSYLGVAKEYWQHCGEGVSSRRAEAWLTGASEADAGEAKQTLKQRIADACGAVVDDVALFPSGMCAVYSAYRAIAAMYPQRQAVQFGFPYVDTLKILHKVGPGAHFFPNGDDADMDALERLLAKAPVAAILCEMPSNPLLTSPDLERLAALARRHDTPLIIDETLATFVNADLLRVADVICTSLTKYFSGVGDVMGGSTVINAQSRFHNDLARALRGQDEDLLWGQDALVLERNSRDFAARMRCINATAARIAEYLDNHRRVARVYYPATQTPQRYKAVMKPGGGYGGLLSILLIDEAETAPRFYDALRVSKGPNLGANYTLACPYTILAHYQELDFARACGVSPYLIRLSIGLEEPADLIERLERALDTL